jgi:predicted Fe-S protein YdhL (DUF1289 family)
MTDKTNIVESPCVRNCCLDDKNMCLGCFRMMDEILIWGQAGNHQKRLILQSCANRKQQHNPTDYS